MTENRHFFLREWRKYRGLTQEQLAERVDTSKSRISDLERGPQKGGFRYNETILELLATALNCTPGQLLDTNPLEASEDTEVVQMFRRIHPSLRGVALRNIESLAEAKIDASNGDAS